MRIAIIGGKLQGVEVAYLAKKAGIETLVIDKNPHAPATGICDRFLEFKFSADAPVPVNIPPVDLILPAIEDMEVLTAVRKWADLESIPLAFDLSAYALSCSKLKSDALFRKLNLPAPIAWPECGFPVVVKPDDASGSHGVEIVPNAARFHTLFPATAPPPDHLVCQQYLEGPSFSIEVTGAPGRYRPLCITDLDMDDIHDCKRITAPTRLPAHQVRQFEQMAVVLAEAVQLKGLMDVEVILHQDELKLLEIDARFPSQTPIAVYAATGINMVKLLADQFAPGYAIPSPAPGTGIQTARHVIVEHIEIFGSTLKVAGEHIMARQGPLTIQPGFFGCDEAVTSYKDGVFPWVATMIFCAESREAVQRKRQESYQQICERFRLEFEDDMK